MHKVKMMPYGTNFLNDGNVEFNFWAPDAKNVKLCLKINDKLKEFEMQKNKDGMYKINTKASDGMLYCYKINNEINVPDPASRYQPQDIHGLSQLINPEKFNWKEDSQWKGKPWEESIIYELHTGTFTEEGTFNSLKENLDYLITLGITTIEIMPVSDFPGKRNWGYDGVLLYSPESSYGTPDELKELIKTAHRKGLMVILDVVYNHFGPDGNYLYTYAKSEFFNDKIKTPWGDAINFKNKNVRDFYINNALYWLNEYHFDGLRIDAVHAINDESSPDIIEEIAQKVKQNNKNERHIHLILENDKNQSKYLGESKHGKYCAQWNDDFHHGIHILTTNEESGYYMDYTYKTTSKFTSHYIAKTIAEGYAYQGEISVFRNNSPRGEKSYHLPHYRFVNFIQNHDQVGNRALGERISLLSNINLRKAAVCLYLLAPQIPLLFMGEEFDSQSPFYFFCDFNKELSEAIKIGRREEFSKFPEFYDPKIREKIPDPSDEKTFLDSKLKWNNWDAKHKQMLDFYKELLLIRKNKIIPILNKIKTKNFEVFTDKSFSVEWNVKLNGYKNLCVFANFGNTLIKLGSKINDENIIAISKAYAKNEILCNGILPPETVFWVLI